MRFLVLLATAVLLAACQTTFVQQAEVKISGLTVPEGVTPGTYRLLPRNKEMDPADLQFREFASYAERALASHGLTAAAQGSKPDLFVFLEYGIGEPQKHVENYTVPTWGQTGVSSSQSTGTLTTYGNTGTYSRSTTYTPTYGVTGYVSGSQEYTTYTRFLNVEGIVADSLSKGGKEPKQVVQVFKTSITSEGSSADLRELVPIMLAAAEPHLATNTGKQVVVMIPMTDDRIRKVKGLPAPVPAPEK